MMPASLEPNECSRIACSGQCRRKAGKILRGGLFGSEPEHADRFEPRCVVQALHDLPEHRRGEAEHGDPLRPDPVRQSGHALPGEGIGMQRRSVQQRGEGQGHAHLGAHREHLHQPVVCLNADRARHPRRVVQRLMVGAHDTLGLPGRARRVDEESQLVRTHGDARIAWRCVLHHRVYLDGRPVARGETGRQNAIGFVAQDDLCIGVGHELPETLLGVARVQHDCNSPGLECRERGHEQRRIVPHEDGDAVRAARSTRQDRVRDSVGGRIQIEIRQLRGCRPDRDAVRMRGSAAFEKAWQRQIGSVGGLGPIDDRQHMTRIDHSDVPRPLRRDNIANPRWK